MCKLLIPARDARAALGVKNTKFYELLATGKLDARKIGSRTYITAESLLAFVDNLPSANGYIVNPNRTRSGDVKGNTRPALPKPAQNQTAIADHPPPWRRRANG